MANGEKELDVGITELALDRPPSLLSLPSDSLASDSIDELLSNDDGISVTPTSSVVTATNEVGESKEDKNVDKIKSSDTKQLEQLTENSKSDIGDEQGKEISLETEITDTQSEGNGETVGKIFCENHYGNTNQTSEITNSQNNIAPKNVSPNRTRYYHGKKLNSCLKKKTVDGNSKRRSISYPEENNFVKEFIEPVDPWRDVRTPSKGEVVSFYKNSCQKQRSKPIEKVLKQIQDIPDLSTRASTLVLRGSRLDNRSCEALESIFRRVQFENLDLENCSLEEDGATAILEMIEFYHSTCKLNIACNPKIGMRGWQALCRMLRKTPCLTYLDARRTLLTDMTMPTFGRCLKADPPLKILHLEGVFLSGRPMLILTTAMKYNKILEELYLGDNDLSSSDGSPIGAMLTYNTTLQLLDLRNNQIKDVGLAHICNGLSDQAEQSIGGLCSLILWNNGLTHEGMAYLTEGLVQTASLKALNLGHNRIGDLGIQKLKSGLIKNKSLHKLGFLNTKLGSEGAVALAEVLADSLSITRIDIRENNIQTAGLMAFSMALKVNQSLLRLDLDKDIRKEPGMEQVMQAVLVDIYNFCHRNKQLARQHLATNSGRSSISSNDVMVRQASTDSNNEYECIVTDDVFHPEGSNQSITPFSPVYTDPNQVAMKFPLQFKEKEDNQNTFKDGGVANQMKTPKTEQELISAISSSQSSIPKQSGVHILNKPPLSSSERRSNRFSVTKIFDSFVSHATGVSNKFANATMESKAKKQQQQQANIPKDEISKTTDNDDILNNKTQFVEQLRHGSEPSSRSLSLDCSSPPPSENDTCINSPIEIIEVSEGHPILNHVVNKQSDNEAVVENVEQSIVTVTDDTSCRTAGEGAGDEDVIVVDNSIANESDEADENHTEGNISPLLNLDRFEDTTTTTSLFSAGDLTAVQNKIASTSSQPVVVDASS